MDAQVLFDQCEAETDAVAHATSTRASAAREPLEDDSAILFGHARAMVLDRDAHRVALRAFLDEHPGRSFAVLASVLEQIGEHTGHPALVDHHDRLFGVG